MQWLVRIVLVVVLSTAICLTGVVKFRWPASSWQTQSLPLASGISTRWRRSVEASPWFTQSGLASEIEETSERASAASANQTSFASAQTSTASASQASFASADVASSAILQGTATPYFYMYEENAMWYKGSQRCKRHWGGTADYIQVADVLLEQLVKHPWRVKDPSKAKWFIVPFDFDLSLILANCEGTTRTQRSNAALDVLEASPYFQRNHGSDHVMFAFSTAAMWPDTKIWKQKKHGMDFVTIPDERRKLVQNMVVGSFLDAHLRKSDPHYGFKVSGLNYDREVDWRCTWLLPVKTRAGLWKEDESFEQWKRERSTLLFFRGKNGGACRDHQGHVRGVVALRNSVQKLVGKLPHVVAVNTHASTSKQYIDEITNSKFCMVMRCDDPQTSRLVDALAAGCIPVIVDDLGNVMARPFYRLINWEAFSVSLPENAWLMETNNMAHYFYNIPDEELRWMHNALQEARKYLLWSHPNSDVATMALKELESRCATPRST